MANGIAKVIQPLQAIERAMVAISGVVVILMMLATTADVVARYILNRPITGVYEFNEYALVVAVFLPFAYTQRVRGHITVDLLQRRLSGKASVVLDLLMLLLIAVVFAFITWDSSLTTLTSHRISEVSLGKIEISVWPFKALVPLGSGFLALCVVTQVMERLVRPGIWRQPHGEGGVDD